MAKTKTVYCIITRVVDTDPWSERQYYRTKKERDRIGSVSRIIGGIRTHRFDLKLPLAEIEGIEFES